MATLKINDRCRYHTDDPTADFPGLGKNPNLPLFNKALACRQLAMMDVDSLSDRARAVKFLLRRVADYYEVIGYVGPYKSHTSEIGYGLAEWVYDDKRYAPWRQGFCAGTSYFHEQAERIFYSIRFACFEMALSLAVWELSQVVPESAEALKRAGWVARNTIRQHCGHNWRDIRNRYGTKRMRKILRAVINTTRPYGLTGGNWLGYFEPRKDRAA